ncbi:hypothetical protein FOA52_003365 [Chlamydomonas sp. UWO 241]|nr:hypothetical protein FOA52_003365 [Chlamydomonas sp. UWO 241]
MYQQAMQYRAPAGMLTRRGAVAWQHSRRAVSTVVRASQPGPHLDSPAAVSEAWVASQCAWVDLAVNQPVELSGTDAKGVAWSSSVHVLGVVHGSAANARSVHEVASAMKPDAAALEQDSSDKTLRNRISKTAQSAPMMKLVIRLMDTPLVSYQQAHGQLTAQERVEWEQSLNSSRIGLGGRAGWHHLLGRPASSDSISAAFITRKLGASFAFIDCPDGRSMFLEERSSDKERKARESALMRLWEEALGESLTSSFQLWVESDPGSELQRAVQIAISETIMPEATPSTLKADPKKMQEASTQRERGMCRIIVDLCSGKLAGKPPQASAGHSGEGPRCSYD